MSHSRSRTVYLTRGKNEFELEIEMEGLSPMVNTVTQISGSKIEHDMDPEVFQQSLTNDELLRIEEAFKP